MSGIICIAPFLALLVAVLVRVGGQIIATCWGVDRNGWWLGCLAPLVVFPIACNANFDWIPAVMTRTGWESRRAKPTPGWITRGGKFTIRRRPIAKRMRAKLQYIRLELYRRMHANRAAMDAWLKAVVQGWYNYYAVPLTTPYLDQFRKAVMRHWQQALRRRSQRASTAWDWDDANRLFRQWIPPTKIMHPWPWARSRST